MMRKIRNMNKMAIALPERDYKYIIKYTFPVTLPALDLDRKRDSMIKTVRMIRTQEEARKLLGLD